MKKKTAPPKANNPKTGLQKTLKKLFKEAVTETLVKHLKDSPPMTWEEYCKRYEDAYKANMLERKRKRELAREARKKAAG